MQGKEGAVFETLLRIQRYLDDDTATLEESIKTRGQSQGQRAGATRDLTVETSRARTLIRQLDALVRPKLGANEERLRAWEVASHIKRSRTTAGETPAASTPATDPSISAAPAAAPSINPPTAA
jgi:hypothetical protein